MQDVIYITLMVAFFGVCVAYARGLDRLVSASEADEIAADLVDPNTPSLPDDGQLATSGGSTTSVGGSTPGAAFS